jgi:16S rRNA A1518/A1519 N6-dimethyltransferase RsmA/KsgA/DIM1 with predicted DNA glycosylase/AP lyase activity
MQRRVLRTPQSRILGQHRLREGAAERLVASTGLAPPQLVFDLGAGDGQLTAQLVKRYGRVVAVEFDRETWSRLKQRFRSEPRVTPVLADLLNVELPREAPYKVVSNLPYSVTAEFMRRLLTLANAPLEAHLELERDAATKWAGLGFESVASVLLKSRFEVEMTMALRRTDFQPHPATDSVVVRLRRRKRLMISPGGGQAFEAFVRRGFGQGRRGLAANIAGSVDRAAVREVLRLAGLGPECQPHELTVETWLALFERSTIRRGAR